MALQTKEHAANVLCREVTAQVPRDLQSATHGCGGAQGEGSVSLCTGQHGVSEGDPPQDHHDPFQLCAQADAA